MTELRQTSRTSRPVKNSSRADSRPKRVPMGTYRDILSVLGKDPDYHYRWVSDVSHRGNRILRLQMAGYELATSEGLTVGEPMVFKTQEGGSIVRQPDGKSGNYLYLMRIPREFYEEDDERKQQEISNVEQQMYSEVEEGSYLDKNRKLQSKIGL